MKSGRIFRTIFKRNCKLYFQLRFPCGHINCDIIQMQLQILHYRFFKEFAIPFENGPEYSSIMKSALSWSCNKLAKQIWQMLQCIFLFLFAMRFCSFEQCNQSQTVDFLNTMANQRCLIWSESTHSWKQYSNNHNNGQGEKHVKIQVH